MSKKLKSENKFKVGKSRKPEFEKIYQLIDSAKSELEKKRWESVLKRLEENPPQKPTKTYKDFQEAKPK